MYEISVQGSPSLTRRCWASATVSGIICLAGPNIPKSRFIQGSCNYLEPQLEHLPCRSASSVSFTDAGPEAHVASLHRVPCRNKDIHVHVSAHIRFCVFMYLYLYIYIYIYDIHISMLREKLIPSGSWGFARFFRRIPLRKVDMHPLQQISVHNFGLKGLVCVVTS